MPINFDLAGKVYDPIEVTISGEDIQRYALASGDTNPRYAIGDDQMASPIFLVVPSLGLMEGAPKDPALNVENMLMLVHGEQRFVYHRPLRPGDEAVLTASLASVEDKGKGATYQVKVAATTADGEPCVDLFATVFVRGGGSGRERPSGSRPEPPAKGPLVATFDRHVAAEMPARYAVASGDHNAIHLDDSVAKAVGLPGAINHGLGTLSLVTGGLVEHMAEGDPERLRSLSVRFTDMVFPDTDVLTSVWESGGGSHLFETRRDDGAVVMSGMLEVAGP